MHKACKSVKSQFKEGGGVLICSIFGAEDLSANFSAGCEVESKAPLLRTGKRLTMLHLNMLYC